nr:sulfotransferase [uncultured Carboxylicivirga sp.]
MSKLVHIINPVKVNESSDLFIAQPITFASIKNAYNFTNSKEIKLVTAQYEIDKSIIPEFFTQTHNLDKSILHYGNFEHKKTLPLIVDIFNRALELMNDQDYLIYTNSDIALQPFFYQYIIQLTKENYDGIIINRRTISNHFTSTDSLPQIYSYVGKNHPGYDCFIIKKEKIKRFILEHICIGANHIGKAILLNMAIFCENLRVIEDKNLTFHLGDDRSWKNPKFTDYEIFNTNEFLNICDKLKRENALKNNIQIENLFYSLITNTINNTDSETKKKYINRLNIKDTHFNLNQFTAQRNISSYNFAKLNSINLHLKELSDPVFVIGFPRSGTTYLQSLLATQTVFYSLPETHFFIKLTKREDLNEFGSITPEKLNDFERLFESTLECKLPSNIKSLMLALSHENLLTRKIAFELTIKAYFDSKKITPSGSILLEKTPYHSYVSKEILEIYPKAKFIVIIRNPIDACSSFNKNLVEYSKPFNELSQDWNHTYNYIDKVSSKYPNNFLLIRYENLINNRTKEIDKISNFLSIKFDNNKLDSFNIEAKKYITNYETWKSTNTDKERPIKKYKITLFDKIIIYKNCRVRMKQNKYKVKFNLIILTIRLMNAIGKKISF